MSLLVIGDAALSQKATLVITWTLKTCTNLPVCEVLSKVVHACSAYMV